MLLGSCFEDFQLPFHPFVEAIAADASVLPDAEVLRRAGWTAGTLAHIAPQLRSALGADAAAGLADGVAQRAEVLAAIHGYLTRAAEARPTLLVLEDLHWATATGRDALRHIARVGGGVPLLVVATIRDTPPDLDDALELFVADLCRLPTVDWIALPGLAEAGVAELLRSLDSDASAPAVFDQSGGNPLLVRELALSRDRPGATLTALLARRYARLGDHDLEVLDIAAVAGGQFDADVVAAASGMNLLDVLESLERAETAGLVAAAPGRPGRFSFVHALFRSARYGALSATRRLRLHRQLAGALQPRSEDDRALPELARHACEAAPLGKARVAIEYARRAAEVAERASAFDEAAAHYTRALDVVDYLIPPDPHARLRLTIRLGAALNRMGEPRHRGVLRDAAADARGLGDAAALADVAWAMSQDGTPTTPGRSDAEFVAIAEDALAGLDAETPARARTLAALSADVWLGGDHTRGAALAAEARRLAGRLHDPLTLGQVLLTTRVARWVPGETDLNLQTADDLVAIGRSTGHSILVIHGLYERALTFRERGDIAAFDDAVEAFASLLDRAAMPYAFPTRCW